MEIIVFVVALVIAVSIGNAAGAKRAEQYAVFAQVAPSTNSEAWSHIAKMVAVALLIGVGLLVMSGVM